MSFVHSSSVPFFVKAATSVSFTFCPVFFMIGYFRGMTIFLPTHPQKSPHPPHTNADDQILKKSDFRSDFQPLSSRDSTVWNRGCDSKVSLKMKKGTFGLQNRTEQNRIDLFTKPTGLGQSPGSTWSFCLGGLLLCLRFYWQCWFIRLLVCDST